MRRALLLLVGLAACRAPASPPRLVAIDAAAPTPDAAPTIVTVRVALAGRAAAEIEREVVLPLEAALGAARVESVAVDGAAWLRAVAVDGREVTLRRIAAVAPQAELLADPAAPRLRYVLVDPRRPAGELRAAHDELLAPRLATVPGVLAVRACGGGRLAPRVEVDGARLAAVGLGLADVVAAVEHAAAERVAELVLRGGVPLLDVATVSLDARGRCWARDAAGPLLLGEVAARDVRAVAARLDELRASLPQGITLRVVDDAAAVTVDLPPGLSDEDALRAADALARTLDGGIVALDRTPDALPQLPSELQVLGARSVPGARAPGAAPPPAGERPELAVIADPTRLARLGLSTRELELAVAAAREGIRAGAAEVWLAGGVTPELRVGKVTLGGVARLERRLVPVALRRRDGQRVP